jgi:NTE family protein
LFHLGALRRLNELGVLRRLSVITSVSGGSITNGVLATRWSRLAAGADGVFTNFDEHVARIVRSFCRRDLRTRLLIGVRLNPANWGVLWRDFFSVPADFLAEEYEKLLQRKQLADLPVPSMETPRFVFCATSVQTGACWHFHGGPNGRMGDFYTGYTDVHGVSVASAVAASSAFPPGFGGLRLRIPHPERLSRTDPWGDERPASPKRQDLPTGTKRLAILTDGGVYDNLGVEPVWNKFRTMLVSDAGHPFKSAATSRQSLIPRLSRAFSISAEQVGAVRRRWLVDEFVSKRRTGALWMINTRPGDFPITDSESYPATVRSLFPEVRTDLNSFTEGEIACLENHGYSLTDAALRSRAPQLCPNVTAPFRWPNNQWCDETVAQIALSRSEGRSILADIWNFLRGG